MTTDRQRIETRFLAALAQPSLEAAEAAAGAALVVAADADAARKAAFRDILWAWINKVEFVLNY